MGSDEQWWRSWWVKWGGPLLLVVAGEGASRLLFETGWIAPLARLLGDILTFEVRISVQVLLLSALLVGLAVWLFARWKLVPDPNPLDQEDYTRDLIGNVVWEWYWFRGKIQGLVAVCPQCGAEMDEVRSPVMSTRSIAPDTKVDGLKCHPCDDVWEFNGDPRNSVKREIERRVRTGEWRDVVKVLGSREGPLEIPISA